MPAAKQSGRTSRPASRGRSSSSSSGSRAQSRSSSRGASSRNGSSGSKSRSQAKKPSNRASAQSSGTRAQSSSNGSRSESGNGTLTNIGIGALSATLGVAGGVLLGRSALQQSRKVLGVSIPSKIDLGGVGQQIGEAGRQFGKLAGEVRAVREKAEQIGKILN